MSLRVFLLGLALIYLPACVRSEVTPISDAQYPPRPPNCDVKIFPSTTPDYNWTDIATVQADCHYTQGRSACIKELREQTCKLGGDTLYGFKDGAEGEYSIVIGTVAVRKPGQPQKTGSLPPKPGPTPPGTAAPPAAAQAGSCSPPCSPGYACHGGVCITLCNPPCANGTRCNQQRVCESMTPASASPPAEPAQPAGATHATTTAAPPPAPPAATH